MLSCEPLSRGGLSVHRDEKRQQPRHRARYACLAADVGGIQWLITKLGAASAGIVWRGT